LLVFAILRALKAALNRQVKLILETLGMPVIAVCIEEFKIHISLHAN
jgi:hypothetical protein